jgi:hypothetical protein
MNRLLFAALATCCFFSCKNKSNEAAYTGKLTREYLAGTWMITGTDLSAAKNTSAAWRDSVDLQFMMHVLKFDKKGNITTDNGYVLPGRGRFEAGDKLLKLIFEPGGRVEYYVVEKAADSSIILVSEKNVNPLFENSRISLKRINTEKYDIGDFSWKQTPSTPLTDAQIRKKMYDMVVYYQHMFEAMIHRNIDVLVPKKIMLPVKFYSTGIDLRDFSETKGWEVFFGGTEPARKAWDMLEAGYDKIETFPPFENNYFKMYAEILRRLAENVKNG